MCDFTKEFKLCSCGKGEIKFREQEFYKMVKGELVKIINKKNEQIPLIFVWQLFRFKRKRNGDEIGRYMLPTENIGNELDAEWIWLNLNTKNCFDFEYIPEEGDNLFIRQNVEMGPYISFIYKNNEWQIDHYDPFDVEIENMYNGKIKNVI